MSLTVLPGFIEESKVWTVWSSCLMCTLLCCVGIAHCLLCQWYLLHPCKDLGFSFFKSVILAGRWPALVFSNTVILMFENAATSGASQMISLLLKGPCTIRKFSSWVGWDVCWDQGWSSGTFTLGSTPTRFLSRLSTCACIWGMMWTSRRILQVLLYWISGDFETGLVVPLVANSRTRWLWPWELFPSSCESFLL